MASVPTISAPTITAPNTGPSQRIDSGVISPEAQSAPGRQMEATGAAVAKEANTQFDAKMTALKTASDLRVADALNKVKQATLDAAYDKDTGYLNLKGNAALERPNGLSLAQEYGQKIDSQITETAATLGNDYQKAEFQKQAGELATTFRGDVQKHALTQYQAYGTSVADGAITLAQQEVGLHWNNPERVDQSVANLKQAVYNKATMTGMSANEAESVMNAQASKLHANVIETALTNNNPSYATGYFAKNKEHMTADDILKVQGQMNTQMDAYSATNATTLTTLKYKQNFDPSDMDRMTNIVMGAESGGHDFNADGTILTSPKGAKGAMQVMDVTSTQPGFGVEPAKDGSPEERNRVGRDYLAAMVKHYGDPGVAMAAYNAGPGKVDDAIEKAKNAGENESKNYLDYLPTETQNYVSKNLAKLNAGDGRPEMPTKLQFVTDALSTLGDNPRPEAIKLARDTAEKQYDMIEESNKEQAVTSLNSAQQELINNGGDFAKLTPATVSALRKYDPANYQKALDFAKAIRSPVETNPTEYALAVSHPEQLTTMKESQFLQYVTTNFSKADGEKIIKLRQDAMTGNADNGAKSINNEAVNQILAPRLAELGINAKPKATDSAGLAKLGNVQQFVRDAIYRQQTALGRKMAPDELEAFTDNLFRAEAQSDRNWIMKLVLPISMQTSSQKLLTMDASDIPSDDEATLRNQFKAKGVPNPSDNDILRAYWAMKGLR